MSSMIKLTYLLILLFVSTGSCSINKEVEIPAFVAEQYNGEAVDLLDVSKDKVTFLNLWSTFCGPCLAESRLLHRLYDKYKNNERFTFITIALNTRNELGQFSKSLDTTNAFAQAFRISKLDSFYMPTLIGLESGHRIFRSGNGYAAGAKDLSEIENISKLFNIEAIPTTFIYNHKGEVVYKSTGVAMTNEGLNMLEELMYKKIDSLLILCQKLHTTSAFGNSGLTANVQQLTFIQLLCKSEATKI